MPEEIKTEKVPEVQYFNDGLVEDVPEEAAVEAAPETKKEEAAPEAEKKVEESSKPAAKEDRVEALERELAEARAQLAKGKAKETRPEAEAKSIEELLDAELDREFNEAPKDAFKNYIKRERLAETMRQDLAHTTNVVQLAAEGKVPGWEDFKELVPEIQAMVEQYKDYVRPEYGGKVQLLELMGWAARGKREAYKAAEKAKQDAKDAADKKAKEEADKAKEKAFMESGASGSPVQERVVSLDDFKKLPLAEMEKYIPYME